MLFSGLLNHLYLQFLVKKNEKKETTKHTRYRKEVFEFFKIDSANKSWTMPWKLMARTTASTKSSYVFLREMTNKIEGHIKGSNVSHKSIFSPLYPET